MKTFRAVMLIFLGIAIIFARAGGAAENQQMDPIDKFLEECGNKDSSTGGVDTCMKEAEKRWDKELNKDYAKLMEALQPKERELLKKSQLLWIKQRDSERELIDGIFSHVKGTMYAPWQAYDSMALVKDRVLQLRRYLREEILDQQSDRQ
jgi:uncharacterized protein YecT (DUF1311 family)